MSWDSSQRLAFWSLHSVYSNAGRHICLSEALLASREELDTRA